MIPRVPVAGSDRSITRIGFGCARLQAGIELRTSCKLVEAALEQGIRHFDTAPAYGASEAVLGEVLAGVLDATITTKVGLPRATVAPRSSSINVKYRLFVRPVLSHAPALKSALMRVRGAVSRWTSHPSRPEPRRRLERDEVLRSLDESLRLLKRDSVDLLLVHEPDQFVLDEELAQVFGELRRVGTIGAFGLAFGRVADTGECFGSVSQGRCPTGVAQRSLGHETRIFHGALRHGWLDRRGRAASRTPGEWLADVLGDYPDDAVIFSASEPHQIRGTVQQAAAAGLQQKSS